MLDAVSDPEAELLTDPVLVDVPEDDPLELGEDSEEMEG